MTPKRYQDETMSNFTHIPQKFARRPIAESFVYDSLPVSSLGAVAGEFRWVKLCSMLKMFPAAVVK